MGSEWTKLKSCCAGQVQGAGTTGIWTLGWKGLLASSLLRLCSLGFLVVCEPGQSPLYDAYRMIWLQSAGKRLIQGETWFEALFKS